LIVEPIFGSQRCVGLPVVSTVHAGIPEAVVHGETGLLAPERDSTALARHLSTLFDNPSLAARLGAAGACRMRQHFNLEVQNAKLEEIYERVVTRG
jgi:colanic acid/amylovoran biosynthesis glycosyltransferase